MFLQMMVIYFYLLCATVPPSSRAVITLPLKDKQYTHSSNETHSYKYTQVPNLIYFTWISGEP